MTDHDEIQHDILLVITTGLFILFALGISEPVDTEGPILLP